MLQNFICYICNETYPSSVLNTHHKIPRAAGGSDDPENLKMLCSGCHDVLHSIASMLANPRRLGMVSDNLRLIYPDKGETRKRCLELARIVQEHMQKKREGGLEDVDTLETVTIQMPKEIKKLLFTATQDTFINGKKIGIARYVLLVLCNALVKKFPLAKPTIEKYLSSSR